MGDIGASDPRVVKKYNDVLNPIYNPKNNPKNNPIYNPIRNAARSERKRALALAAAASNPLCSTSVLNQYFTNNSYIL